MGSSFQQNYLFFLPGCMSPVASTKAFEFGMTISESVSCGSPWNCPL